MRSNGLPDPVDFLRARAQQQPSSHATAAAHEPLLGGDGAAQDQRRDSPATHGEPLLGGAAAGSPEREDRRSVRFSHSNVHSFLASSEGAQAPREDEAAAAGRAGGGGPLALPRNSVATVQTVASDATTADPRQMAGQMCTCLPEKHCSRDVAIFLLGIVDLGHVVTTLLNMSQLEAEVPNLVHEIQDTGVEFRINACQFLYWAKVATHTGLVVFKMMHLGCGTKMQQKYGKDDLLTRWRHKQEWFVAMTFNSFLMLPVFLFIRPPPTETGEDLGPFDLVRWKKIRNGTSKWTPWKLTPGQDSGRFTVAPTRAQRGAVSEMGRATGTTAPESGRLKAHRVGLLTVFAKTGAGGLGFWPSYVMVTNIACTVLAMLINVEALYFERTDGHRVGTALSALSLVTVAVHFTIAAWLYLYAKMAQSQARSLLRSAAALAIGFVDASQVVLSIMMVFAFTEANCTVDGWTHVACSRDDLSCSPDGQRKENLGCNETWSQPTQYHRDGAIGTWSDLCWVWLVCISVAIAAQAVLATLQARQVMTKSLSDDAREEVLEGTVDQRIAGLKRLIVQMHSPNSFVPWYLTVPTCGTRCCGCCCPRSQLSQDMLGDIQKQLDGIEVAANEERAQNPASKSAEKRLLELAESYSDTSVEQESNAFAAVSFNTWMMVPALLALKQPYSKNLLEMDSDKSPFCRPYSFNSNRLANLLIATVTLCRTLCMSMCVYIEVSQYWGTGVSGHSEWGALTRINTATPLFSFKPSIETYILCVTRLFMAQTFISFGTTFLWTNPLMALFDVTRNKMTAVTLLMLTFCLLDLAVVSSTGYYAACIRFPKSPLFECERDFGGWIVDPANQIQNRNFQRIADGMLVLYSFRIVLQTWMFWVRRTAAAAPEESSDQVPLLTIVYSGIFHGVFILLSQYPLDLPHLLTGRWGILQPRPHWTNGLQQVVVLVEKTMMGYLILELAFSDPLKCDAAVATLCHGNVPPSPGEACDGEVCPPEAVRSWVKWLFTVQAFTQFWAFFYQQVARPGRDKSEVKLGDHVQYVNFRESDAARIFNNGGGAMEVLKVRPAQAGTAGRREYKVEVRIDHGHSTEGRWISQADVERVESSGWQVVVVLLAFLDWFHIAFNLTNLVNMLTNNRWRESHADTTMTKERILVGLCYLCISIYSVRIIAQPVLLVWRGAPLTFSTYVYHVLTAVDIAIGVLLLLAGIELSTAKLLSLGIPLILIGGFSLVTAYMGWYALNKSAVEGPLTGCLYKSSNGLHMIIGAIALMCGIAVAVKRDELIEGVRPHQPLGSVFYSIETWTDVAQWVLQALALSNFLQATSSAILARIRPQQQVERDVNSGRSSNPIAMIENEVGGRNDATAQWNQDAKWYSALTFNTFLMLPAMMLVDNPYRDSAKTVTDSFIRLGSKGWIDYFAGSVLFLMVLKKSVNAYLIVEWLRAEGKTENIDVANIVSLTLLVVHFVATLYVMMVPKLAFSQRPNFRDGEGRCGCVSAATKATLTGIFLLTISLVDWISLLVNLMSLINLLQMNVKNSAACHTASVIVKVATASMVCFVVRVVGQMVVYLGMRYHRGSLRRPQHINEDAPGYDPDFRNTSQSLDQSEPDDVQLMRASEMRASRKAARRASRRREYQQWKAEWGHPWREWRDLFQQLSFNSWMMVPALLFIEKPYHRNLLKRDKSSPFRRMHWCIGLVFSAMLCKKVGVIYVNFETVLAERCLDELQEDPDYSRNVAIVALSMTGLHSIIWFFTMFGQFMGCCSGGEDVPTDTSSSEEEESDSDDDDGGVGRSRPVSPDFVPAYGQEPEPEPEPESEPGDDLTLFQRDSDDDGVQTPPTVSHAERYESGTMSVEPEPEPEPVPQPTAAIGGSE